MGYKEVIALLSEFAPMSCKELIDMENDEETLLHFLTKLCYVSFLSFLMIVTNLFSCFRTSDGSY